MSRFLKEIPLELLDSGEVFTKKTAGKEEIKQDFTASNPYFHAKKNFKAQPFSVMKGAQQFAVSKEKGLDYKIGDRVQHIKFGAGVVEDITEGGRDYEVTVEFDTAGRKKMFASFAKLVKIE
ncbi:ATP-dependent DNA helicase pcrA [uncultured Clostridium sp.]|nr:hypothetical protein [Mediterraneibacter massiliensis]SCI59389.1 ATP-dependent DNA helicase pcrA [uncultured Clostridium sp.]